MAKGPAPKDPSRRRRRNSDPMGRTTLRYDPAPQPKLPGKAAGWPARTRQWWRMWGASPLAEGLTAVDWDYLIDTAYLHAAFVQGNMSVASELRLRVAKFGATPEDRARLRIDMAPVGPTGQGGNYGSAGDRYGDLRVLDDRRRRLLDGDEAS